MITLEEFFDIYPSFAEKELQLPAPVWQMFLEIANATAFSSFGATQKMCLCLYVAHLATLYLKDADASADGDYDMEAYHQCL